MVGGVTAPAGLRAADDDFFLRLREAPQVVGTSLPAGRRMFAQTVESAGATRVIALNQGLYKADGRGRQVTAKPPILPFQAAPASLARVARPSVQ